MLHSGMLRETDTLKCVFSKSEWKMNISANYNTEQDSELVPENRNIFQYINTELFRFDILVLLKVCGEHFNIYP